MERRLAATAPKLGLWIALLTVTAALTGLAVLVQARAPDNETNLGQAALTDDEVGRLFDRPLPGLSERRSTPTATGNRRADARIRDVALARGYQLRGEAVDPLGTYQGRRLQRRAIDDLVELQAAMFDEIGVRLTLTSAFRTTTRQREIFRAQVNASSLRLRGRVVTNNEIALGFADDVIGAAMRIAAPPGFSRHHTGLTIDVSSEGLASFSFAKSRAYAWLTKNQYSNALVHGWVASYPPGAGSLGPNPEPWEWVWIGRDAATCAVARTCATGALEEIATAVVGWATAPEDPATLVYRLQTAGGTQAITVTAINRYDVALALALDDPGIGFQATRSLPKSARWACVEAQTSPGGPWNAIGCKQAK